MRRTSTLILIAFAALAIAQGVSLARRPKANEETRYRTTLRLKEANMAVVIEGDWREKIVRVGADGGWTVEQALTGVSIDIGGQKITTEDSTLTTVEYLPDGLIKTFSRDRAKLDDLRLARAVIVPMPAEPVASGREWTKLGAADLDSKAPAILYRMKLVGTERVQGVEALKVQMSTAEQSGDRPMTVEGHSWLRISDGAVLRRVVKIKNAPIGQGSAPQDLDWTFEWVK